MAIRHGKPVVFLVAKPVNDLQDNQIIVALGSPGQKTLILLGNVVIDEFSLRCKRGRTPFTAVIIKIEGYGHDKLNVGDIVEGYFERTAFAGNGVLTVMAPRCT